MRLTKQLIFKLIFAAIILATNNVTYGWGLKDVFKNLHVNKTNPGNYQDSAAGYYSGGGAAIRTKNTSIEPLAATAPSLSTGCNGIDAHFGSFSMINSGQLVQIAKNVGSQALVYGFHLGLKTYAPQIETILKDLRNLQMELNQFGIDQCKITQSAFAAALPQNTAMYEQVCSEISTEHGIDLGGQRKKCKDHTAQKKAVDEKQEKDPEVLIDNHNLFIKAAKTRNIPKELYPELMSMVGTIVVKDGVVMPYPSLAEDAGTWNAYLNGGIASRYECDNDKCLNISVKENINIDEKDSYAGKAKNKISSIKEKMIVQRNELSLEDQGFVDSIEASFPVFGHIALEAASGIQILNSSSDLVARYLLMCHLKQIISDIKKGIYYLKNKQINDTILNDYEQSLTRLNDYADNQLQRILEDSDRVNNRVEKIWKHLMARERN